MSVQPDPSQSSDHDDFYNVYAEYAKTLRAWFVAYGVGGPVLCVTNETVSKKIVQSGEGVTIAILFLLGVAFQVFIALLNKCVNWKVYATWPEKRETCLYKTAEIISRQFWIDMICDIASIAMFAWATVKTLFLFV